MYMSVCHVLLRMCVIVVWASLPDTNKFDLIKIVNYKQLTVASGLYQ